MPVYGTKSPTPALPNLIGKGRKRKMERMIGGADRTMFEQLGDFGRAHKDKVYAWRLADDLAQKRRGGANAEEVVKRVSGMVVPQIHKLYTENIGHSGNQAIQHPAEYVDLAKMILPRGGGRMRRVSRDSFKVSQFRDGVMNEPMPYLVDAMYEFP
jgi:hypothetical protein